MDAVSSDENELTLSWLDDALGYAVHPSRERLASLLRDVREEIVFEIRVAEGLSDTLIDMDRERERRG